MTVGFLTLDFLTPAGAVLALGALLPLAGLLLARRRAGRVRETLGLRQPRFRTLLVALSALLALSALVGLAAAQPVVEWTSPLRARTDAEALVVVDVSRSMLARRAGGPTRLERAQAAALELREALPQLPFGVASITDRTLPHLFPSADHDVFEATLTRSLGIEQPPPRSTFATVATDLESLAAVRTHRYFSPRATRRFLVVFTDGESQPVSGARLATLFRQRQPPIDLVLVQVWRRDERVYSGGTAEPQYRPDPASRQLLEGVARSVSGAAFDESELDAAERRMRELLGSGPTVVQGERQHRVVLAPYLAAAVLVPLALLLWRRDR